MLFFLSSWTIQQKSEYNLPNNNVVYVGMRNPLIVYDFESGDRLIGPEEVSILQGTGIGNFYIIPKKVLNNFTLKVVDENDSVKSEIKLRCLQLPVPEVSILGIKEGLIASNRLKDLQQIEVEMPCFIASNKPKVISFTVTINNAGSIDSFKQVGDKLNAEARSSVQKLERGSRIYLEDIKVKMPNGEVRKCVSIILKVK
jgi:hypothetical protein